MTASRESPKRSVTAAIIAATVPTRSASQVSFRVFYLGPSFKGVPLRGAKVWGAHPGGAARADVIYDYSESGGPSDSASPAVVTLLESSASDGIAKSATRHFGMQNCEVRLPNRLFNERAE
jgi:hypothetical protein